MPRADDAARLPRGDVNERVPYNDANARVSHDDASARVLSDDTNARVSHDDANAWVPCEETSARVSGDAGTIDRRHALAAATTARGGDALRAEELAQRLGEDAFAALVAAMRDDGDALVARAADLLDHLATLWAVCGVAPAAVWAELDRRRGTGGHAEKAARGSAANAAGTSGNATHGD